MLRFMVARFRPNPPTTILNDPIKATEAEIERLEKELKHRRYELALLRKTQQEILAGPDAPKVAEPVSPLQKEGPRGVRSLSATWKRILAKIGARQEDGASINEISEFCRQEGIEQKPNTLRAQMSFYVNKHGYLERSRRGNFVLTPRGAAVSGFQPT